VRRPVRRTVPKPVRKPVRRPVAVRNKAIEAARLWSPVGLAAIPTIICALNFFLCVFAVVSQPIPQLIVGIGRWIGRLKKKFEVDVVVDGVNCAKND
jgi:hypothetical protein